MSAESEIIKTFYSSLNSGDLARALSLFHEDVVRVEFEGHPSVGRFQGLKEMKEHLLKGRSTWAEGGCNPTKIITAADRWIVLVHVRVRLKDQTEWLDGKVADAFLFREGKIVEMRTFFEKQEAFLWAGVAHDTDL